MARTETPQVELGMSAPDFELPDVVGGDTVGRTDYADEPLLIMFICNHCPYVKAVRRRFIDLADDFGDRVGFVAISSNDAERYPDDSPERMKEVAEEYGYPFPYLYDESQEVAEAYGAVCTPDFFLFDADHRLAYRGRLDDDWKHPEQVTRPELRAAIEAVLAGDEPEAEQHPAVGCSIKWKY